MSGGMVFAIAALVNVSVALRGGRFSGVHHWPDLGVHRGPACGKYLGRSIGLCECPRCGITLRLPACNPSGSPAGYTEDQEKQFKLQFAARQRRQRVAATSAVVAVLLGVIAGAGSGVSLIRLIVILAAAVFVLGVLVFSFVNWRCPACGRYLGQIPIRRQCPKCGVALR
jgi:hypothetical protein